MADDKGSKKAGEGCLGGGGDVMSVGPNLGGICPFVRHHADHTIETGMARIAGPGEPPSSENSLFLTHQEGGLFKVQPMVRGGSDTGTTKGPAKVSTPAFREGWDNIFGKKTPVGQA